MRIAVFILTSALLLGVVAVVYYAVKYAVKFLRAYENALRFLGLTPGFMLHYFLSVRNKEQYREIIIHCYQESKAILLKLLRFYIEENPETPKAESDRLAAGSLDDLITFEINKVANGDVWLSFFKHFPHDNIWIATLPMHLKEAPEKVYYYCDKLLFVERWVLPKHPKSADS